MLDSVLPVIQCDYGYLTDVGEEPVIALFASCRSSTNLFATLCTQKGPKDTYVVAAFASWIWELGHVRLIIQSDGEDAILALDVAFFLERRRLPGIHTSEWRVHWPLPRSGDGSGTSGRAGRCGKLTRRSWTSPSRCRQELNPVIQEETPRVETTRVLNAEAQVEYRSQIADEREAADERPGRGTCPCRDT